MPVAIDRAQVAAALPAYELGRRLGAGAYGLVLAGRHRALDRLVAIKIVSSEFGPTREPRFEAEGRVLAGLKHPHIVDVYDYVEHDDLHLIIMELLSGGTLARRRPALSAPASCAVGLAVADALGAAHRAGILHRDIKPDNVLFAADNLPKVTDFGIAKMFSGAAVAASAAVGTPKYMAPEQVDAGQLSPATDLYALGVVLYELLSGVPPFDPERLSLAALYRHHLEVEPPPPTGVPVPLADVVLRTLAKHPSARYPSAHAFALDLARAATRTFGPGWAAGTGMTLRIAEDVRAAALVASPTTAPSRPVQPPRSVESYRPSRPPAPARSSVQSVPPGSPVPFGPSGPPTPARRPWRRRRWAVPSAALVMVLAALSVVYVTGHLGADRGGDPPPDTREAAAAPGLIVTNTGYVLAEAAPVAGGVGYQRVYPDGSLYALITGHRASGVVATGLEQSHDNLLRGLDERLPQGQAGTVETTLDETIQSVAAEALGGAHGAVVAMDPRTGAILALVSGPSYDPNVLASQDGAQAQETLASLRNDPSRPLLDRVTEQTYPPGAVFEIVTSAAALSSGVVSSADQPVFAPPTLNLPGSDAVLTNSSGDGCRLTGGDGPPQTRLSDALESSCATAFGQLGIELGGERLRYQAEAFGINGTVEGFPLPQARSEFPADLDDAQLALAAVGEFDVRVTPLQMTQVVAAIANGGVRMRPYVVDALRGPQPSYERLERTEPQTLGQAVSPDVAAELTTMMQGVVDAGSAAQIPGVAVAGTSGAADYGDAGKAHAWFVGFAPAASPTVAVAVIVEGSGPEGGGEVAAPIARQVMQAALESS